MTTTSETDLTFRQVKIRTAAGIAAVRSAFERHFSGVKGDLIDGVDVSCSTSSDEPEKQSTLCIFSVSEYALGAGGSGKIVELLVGDPAMLREISSRSPLKALNATMRVTLHRDENQTIITIMVEQPSAKSAQSGKHEPSEAAQADSKIQRDLLDEIRLCIQFAEKNDSQSDLNPDGSANFFVNGKATGKTFRQFTEWAYSNIEVPFIRGVAVEFLLVQHLIENADEIALDHASRTLVSPPMPGDLAVSAKRWFETQISGDVFDLQLEWGITFEFKSTASPESWRLQKTKRWNSATLKAVDEWILPAQFYILAEFKPGAIKRSKDRIDFTDVTFHVCSGRRLDEIGTADSVGYSQFVSKAVACSYEEIPAKLHSLIEDEYKRVEELMRYPLTWRKFPSDESFDDCLKIPFFLDDGRGGIIGWYKNVDSQWIRVKRIAYPWKKDANPTWRDWEILGFKYDNSIKYDEALNVGPLFRH